MDKPTRKELTHERIVDAASRAIRRSGYAGIGVADIMKEAGLTHGGFYAHFESRDALLAEAVAKAGRDTATALDERIRTRVRDEGVSTLRALIEYYLADAHMVAAETGCVISAVCSEMPRQAEGVRQASALRVRALIERVRRALPDGADTADAIAITSTMVGAMQLARGVDDERQGKLILKNARRALIEQYDVPLH